MSDPIVSADWLVANLDQVVVLDASYVLMAEPETIRADFLVEHIPGARLFEIDKVSDPDAALPHMLPSEEHFSAAMAELGVDGSRPVVVYDRSANHFSAPRVWFALKLFGVPECYVLNGGLAAWKARGERVESGEPVAAPVAAKRWTLDRSRVVSGAQMSDFVSSGSETILDARAHNRFVGEAPEPRPGLISGHMPGSVCVPFAGLTDAEGNFQSVDSLREHFSTIDSADPIVSCGSGITACVLALGLERIGVKARLYDGSWSEWGQGKLGSITTAD